MRYCMKQTSVVLDEGLLEQARKRAAEGGFTLNELVDRALRDLLAKRATVKSSPFRSLSLGGMDPRVDHSLAELKRALARSVR